MRINFINNCNQYAKKNSKQNFGAKFEDTIRESVVRYFVSSPSHIRSAMQQDLKTITDNCKGAIIYRSARTVDYTSYSLAIPCGPKVGICDIPDKDRENIPKILNQIATELKKIDPLASRFHEAATCIDKIMTNG